MAISQGFAIIRIDKVAVRDLADWHTAAQRYAPKCARRPTCLTVLNPKDPPSREFFYKTDVFYSIVCNHQCLRTANQELSEEVGFQNNPTAWIDERF